MHLSYGLLSLSHFVVGKKLPELQSPRSSRPSRQKEALNFKCEEFFLICSWNLSLPFPVDPWTEASYVACCDWPLTLLLRQCFLNTNAERQLFSISFWLHDRFHKYLWTCSTQRQGDPLWNFNHISPQANRQTMYPDTLSQLMQHGYVTQVQFGNEKSFFCSVSEYQYTVHFSKGKTQIATFCF